MEGGDNVVCVCEGGGATRNVVRVGPTKMLCVSGGGECFVSWGTKMLCWVGEDK